MTGWVTGGHPRGMSTADVPPVLPGLPRGAGATPEPRRVATSARHLHRAQLWAAGVLWTASLALGGYLFLLAAAASVAGWMVEVVRPGAVGPLDTSALVLDALPALLVGWCTGMAASVVLARGEALGARMAGVTAGGVGVLAGALVLRLTGLL